MPGLVPGIHVFPVLPKIRKSWMAGSSPAITQGMGVTHVPMLHRPWPCVSKTAISRANGHFGKPRRKVPSIPMAYGAAMAVRRPAESRRHAPPRRAKSALRGTQCLNLAPFAVIVRLDRTIVRARAHSIQEVQILYR